MQSPRSIQIRDSVSLRLRVVERVLGAEVLEIGEKPLLRIHSGVIGLSNEHFQQGLDLDVYDKKEGHFSASDLKVLEFIANKLELRVLGPIELRAIFKRTSDRDEVGLPIRIESFSGHRTLSGQTSDLGGGGVSFTTNDNAQFKVGENIRFELDIKDLLVSGIARVAWLSDQETYQVAGLAFVEVDRDSHDHLYRFIYGLRRQRQQVR